MEILAVDPYVSRGNFYQPMLKVAKTTRLMEFLERNNYRLQVEVIDNDLYSGSYKAVAELPNYNRENVVYLVLWGNYKGYPKHLGLVTFEEADPIPFLPDNLDHEAYQTEVRHARTCLSDAVRW